MPDLQQMMLRRKLEAFGLAPQIVEQLLASQARGGVSDWSISTPQGPPAAAPAQQPQGFSMSAPAEGGGSPGSVLSGLGRVVGELIPGEGIFGKMRRASQAPSAPLPSINGEVIPPAQTATAQPEMSEAVLATLRGDPTRPFGSGHIDSVPGIYWQYLVQDTPAGRAIRSLYGLPPHPDDPTQGHEGQGPEDPAEMARMTMERDRERRKLMALRGVAEHLGSINIVTPGHYMVGPPPQQKQFIAEDIREEQMRLEDQLTPQELDYYKRLGIPVQPGMRRSTMRGGVSPYGMMREQGIMQRHADNLPLRQSREERAQAAYGRLREPARVQMADYDKAINAIDRLEELAQNAKFGPIEGRWQEFARFIGMADADTVNSAAALAHSINRYIYTSTGKQLNQEEMKRLSKELPQVWDSPEAFSALVEGFRSRLLDQRDIELESLRREDYDTADWEERARPTWDKGRQGQVQVIDPDTGKEATILLEDLQEAEARGWRRR